MVASPRFMTIGQTLTLQIAAKGLSVVITSIGFGRTKSQIRSAHGCGLHPGAHPLTTLVKGGLMF